MKGEELISKCVAGKTSSSIIKELEEELPDSTSLRLELLSYLKRLGVPAKIKVDESYIKVSVSVEFREDVNLVIDTYMQVYPEYNFFVVVT